MTARLLKLLGRGVGLRERKAKKQYNIHANIKQWTKMTVSQGVWASKTAVDGRKSVANDQTRSVEKKTLKKETPRAILLLYGNDIDAHRQRTCVNELPVRWLSISNRSPR